MESDAQYFARRAAEEEQAAAAAEPLAAEIHLLLARKYADLAEQYARGEGSVRTGT
jgi:hypothetical protein